MEASRTLRDTGVVRARRLRTARGELAALEAVPDGAVRGTAVLVPGFTGSKEDFLPVLGPLRERGWHVLAYDQRGQNESPHAPPSAYALDELAADARAVARALGGAPVHLLGHSLGGLVARAAVVADADPWASLVLLCSGPGALPHGPRELVGRLLGALPVLPLVDIHRESRRLDALSGRPQPSAQEEAFLERRFVAGDPEGLRVLGRVLQDEPDRTPALAAAVARARLPVLVAHGEHDDRWSPAEQRAMAVRLGARLAVLPGAAHSPAVEAPGATAELLAGFWADAPPGEG